MKLTNEQLKEIDKYYPPKPEVVTKLPDVKGMKDFAKVYLKEGLTYKEYILIEGNWKLVNTIS